MSNEALEEQVEAIFVAIAPKLRDAIRSMLRNELPGNPAAFNVGREFASILPKKLKEPMQAFARGILDAVMEVSDLD